MSRRSKLSKAPLAVASDGAVLVNAGHLSAKDDLADVIAVAEKTGLPVFVGVAVPVRLRRAVLRDIDDALADVVGRLGPALARPDQRRRRPRSRIKRKTVS